SSARIERWLQLCAEDNLTVAYPSTPAQYFHLLRRQSATQPRRPCVVFPPKSMLRLRASTSATEDFTGGGWQEVLADHQADPAAVTRARLCAGKIYYDLAAARKKRGITDVALIRVEQLYPTPTAAVVRALAAFPRLRDLAWVQEEPANQGAWPHMALSLPDDLAVLGLAAGLPEDLPLRRISRPAAASPATGSTTRHEAEQAAVIDAAFEG
ncbi:MAG: multifunctional oxoglutarate decarboxylase/oxoglutarate dehydrogenase thiamine pyrophosphate-binding subunit/dihydrolipoyllysine-residue succinyltransferase subunit, partial [Frankiaceae bacterium]